MRHQKSARELEEREASKTYNIQALVMATKPRSRHHVASSYFL